MMNEINKEAENPELTGLPMQSFKFIENSSPEDMFKQLIELFGKSGDERNIFVEKMITKYIIGEYSLLQLTRSVFNDDIFDAVMHCSNNPKVGVRTLPNNASTTKDLNRKLCIDLSTIIVLCEFQKAKNIKFSHRFIISKHSQEYFSQLLSLIQNEIVSNFKLNITSTGVTSFLNEKELIDRKIEFLTYCISWINENCDILTSPEKINFLVNATDNESNINSFFLSYTDTISLTIEYKAILITDEKTILRVLQRSSFINTEFYLKNSSINISNEDIYEFLSEKTL